MAAAPRAPPPDPAAYQVGHGLSAVDGHGNLGLAGRAVEVVVAATCTSIDDVADGGIGLDLQGPAPAVQGDAANGVQSAAAIFMACGDSQALISAPS